MKAAKACTKIASAARMVDPKSKQLNATLTSLEQASEGLDLHICELNFLTKNRKSQSGERITLRLLQVLQCKVAEHLQDVLDLMKSVKALMPRKKGDDDA